MYKTRTQATDACRAGKVKVGGVAVKPSCEVREGTLITLSVAPILKSIQVTGFPGHRVAAKLVAGFMDDKTPQAEYDKLKSSREVGFEYRSRGIGRPTKRERREIEVLKKYLGE